MNSLENQNSVCYVARIGEIVPIPGADNIEVALAGGWQAIVQKGQYKVGGFVVIATTDAVIPQDLSDAMNVTNYLRKGGRVRTMKLRGVYSECLIIPLAYLSFKKDLEEGVDCMDILGIYKYEPPAVQVQLASGRKIKYHQNPNFTVYYKFPNIKNVTGMFSEDDYVQITRKIHGTNARYGIVKKRKLSIWDRVKKFFTNNIWAEYEFIYGSHNVEKGSDTQGFYDTDVWREVADKYDIKNKLWEFAKKYSPAVIGSGVIIYGEVYGPGIQKNYDYGLKELEFAGFDVIVNGVYQDTVITKHIISVELSLPHVPELLVANWSHEIQDQFTFNNFIEGTKVPHEGIVIKHTSGERNKIAKVINPDYHVYSEKHQIDDESIYNH